MLPKEFIIEGLLEAWDSDFLLAKAFFSRTGLNLMDHEKEIADYCEKISASEDRRALHAASKLYRIGFAGQIDQMLSLSLCVKSANKGYLPALHWLWSLQSDFIGVSNDAETSANEALLAAVSRAYPPALFTLGIKYFALDDEKQKQRGFQLLEQAADFGEANAQLFVGEKLISSNDVANVSRGVSMIILAAESGYRPAMRCLSDLHLTGFQGVEKNIERSRLLASLSNVAEPSSLYYEKLNSWSK